jgi:hypothetical protein
VKDNVEQAGWKLLDDFDGHPSIRALVEEGYQVIFLKMLVDSLISQSS